MSDYWEGDSDYAFDMAEKDAEVFQIVQEAKIEDVAVAVMFRYELLDERFKEMMKSIAQRVLSGKSLSEKQEKALRNCYYINFFLEP